MSIATDGALRRGNLPCRSFRQPVRDGGTYWQQEETWLGIMVTSFPVCTGSDVMTSLALWDYSGRIGGGASIVAGIWTVKFSTKHQSLPCSQLYVIFSVYSK